MQNLVKFNKEYFEINKLIILWCKFHIDLRVLNFNNFIDSMEFSRREAFDFQVFFAVILVLLCKKENNKYYTDLIYLSFCL
jgi:hypothetical protein